MKNALDFWGKEHCRHCTASLQPDFGWMSECANSDSSYNPTHAQQFSVISSVCISCRGARTCNLTRVTLQDCLCNSVIPFLCTMKHGVHNKYLRPFAYLLVYLYSLSVLMVFWGICHCLVIFVTINFVFIRIYLAAQQDVLKYCSYLSFFQMLCVASLLMCNFCHYK